MKKYLRATNIIDWNHPAVLEQAMKLKGNCSDPVKIAKACFEWVRDNIKHSGDCKAEVTTVKASEVLEHGTGWCFAKSHLLAALLRANGIPAGLCYQRLCRDDGKGFTLHGLNAVFLPEFGWHRIDSRGQRPGCDAQFCPPREKLAFPVTEEGEMDFWEIWPDPAPVVIECLEKHTGWEAVAANLPDIAFIVK